jgi:hypothetical protein
MQIPSVASQLQSQLIQSTKPGQQTNKPQANTNPVDTDGDQDGNPLSPDKGQAIDTKA